MSRVGSGGSRSPDRVKNIWSERIYLEIDRKNIGLARFILESYDNAGLLSVVDKYRAVVCIRFAPGCDGQISVIINNLEYEMPIRVIPCPNLTTDS